MCVNCISNAEAVVASGALAAAALRRPVHDVLASLGLVEPYDVRSRDSRTTEFLRSLELDPVEILGAVVVAAADAWRDERALRQVGAGVGRGSMRSQSALATA
jgi:hypothetical protein